MSNVRVSWIVESTSKDLLVAVCDSVKLGTLTTDHPASSRGLPVLIDDSGNPLGSAEVGQLRVMPAEFVNDDAGQVSAVPMSAEQIKTIESAKLAGYLVK